MPMKCKFEFKNQILVLTVHRSALIVLLARQDTHTNTLSSIEKGLAKDRAERETIKLSEYKARLCKVDQLI